MGDIGPQGENLIFLISQPRAGSTMLQRMLATHPEIHTVAEPWLMLHPLYALRGQGMVAEYDAALAAQAVKSFLGTIADGEEAYVEGVRRMCAHIYTCSLKGSGKQRFLDKTPRYYLVIRELHRTFPRARYIILLRNPLAVLCSMLNTWVKHNLALLGWLGQDLICAPSLLLEGIELLGEQGTVVRYEDLVRDPEREMVRLCGDIGLQYLPTIVDYGHANLARWQLGDQHQVYSYTRPSPDSLEAWVHAVANPQVWRLASSYLRRLGPNTTARLGYSYEELQDVLHGRRPSFLRRSLTVPMSWLLSGSPTRICRGRRYLLVGVGALHQYGFWSAFRTLMRRVGHASGKDQPWQSSNPSSG